MVSDRISAVVPRPNTFGSHESQGRDRNGEPADGHSLLAARVAPKALQCHNGIVGYSRWECQRMKPGETAGIWWG